jgi:hypothetical protein
VLRHCLPAKDSRSSTPSATYGNLSCRNSEHASTAKPTTECWSLAASELALGPAGDTTTELRTNKCKSGIYNMLQEKGQPPSAPDPALRSRDLRRMARPTHDDAGLRASVHVLATVDENGLFPESAISRSRSRSKILCLLLGAKALCSAPFAGLGTLCSIAFCWRAA